MDPKFFRRLRLGNLELLLVLAIISLGLQLFPAAARMLLWVLDVRNWPRSVWLWLNVVAVLALFGVRFGPGLFADWKARRSRIQAEGEVTARKKEQREHREMIARLKEGRRRRLY